MRRQQRANIQRNDLQLWLTPQSTPLLGKLTHAQIFKNIPVFYKSWWFITLFIRICHRTISWATRIKYRSFHYMSWWFVIILLYHLRLGLPSDPFLWDVLVHHTSWRSVIILLYHLRLSLPSGPFLWDVLVTIWYNSSRTLLLTPLLYSAILYRWYHICSLVFSFFCRYFSVL
jgi:hypothetical protein